MHFAVIYGSGRVLRDFSSKKKWQTKSYTSMHGEICTEYILIGFPKSTVMYAVRIYYSRVSVVMIFLFEPLSSFSVVVFTCIVRSQNVMGMCGARGGG